MFQYIRFTSVLLFSWSCVCTVHGLELWKYSSVNLIYGEIIENIELAAPEECILHCISQSDCKAVLFPGNSEGNCLEVKPGTTFINFTGYDYYEREKCADPNVANYDFLITAGLPCPRLYFPLDTDTGTRRGPSKQNIKFVSDGKMGKAFLNPLPGGSYYRLGYYPSSDFCFPLPETCPLGITVAFWLKILSDTGTRQGILTTREQNRYGFAIDFGNNLAVNIRRSDGKKEELRMSGSTFLTEHGFNEWVHLVMTHKMHGMGTNINLYLNGEARPDSEKDTPTNANHNGVNGHLEIGNRKVGQNSYIGHIMVDDLVIYEHEMSAGDVVKLYNIYK